MNTYDETREEQINSLLDGDLSPADAEQLQTAAGDDRELAQAIVAAYQLQQAMDTIQVEHAPASLGRRLRAIPREQRSRTGFRLLQPRWVMALAAFPLVLIAVSLLRPATPSASEIAQARQDIVLAFAYLDKAGEFAGREIETVIGSTMVEAVAGHMIRNIKFQQHRFKEQKA